MMRAAFVGLVMALGHAQSAGFDSAAFIQRSLNAHSDPPKAASPMKVTHVRPLGQKVMIEGFETEQPARIVGYGETERYHLEIEGADKPLMNIEGKNLRDWHPAPTLYPPSVESMQSKSYVVGKGEKEGTWNIYVPGEGVQKNVDADTAFGKSTTGKPLPLYQAMKKARREEQEHAAEEAKLSGERARLAEERKAMLAREAEEHKEERAKFAEELKKQAEKLSKEAAARAKEAQEADAAAAAKIEKELITLAKKKAGRTVATLKLKGKGLGFERQKKGRGKRAALFIGDVLDEGALAQWNAAHPLQAVATGDKILQVEGQTGTAEDMEKALQMADLKKPATVHLLTERSMGVRVKQLGGTAKLIMEKGAMGYLRDALPFDIGKELINEKETVTSCSDISSSFICSQSTEKYGLACAGWTGTECAAKGEVQCASISNEAICKEAEKKVGIPCAGWGGSSCLPPDSPASAITDKEACNHAEALLGIKAAGWGGEACLAKEASCSEITLPGICNDAKARLGLECRGWGGSSCLGPDATPNLITQESFCRRAKERFGIESAAGWSGSACLSKEEASCELISDAAICQRASKEMGIECAGWSGATCLTKQEARCQAITDEGICQQSRERLGIDCAGWGGASCLDLGAPAELITSASICARAERNLGIAAAGWSGSSCLPAGPVKCSDITQPGICNDSLNRLGVQCAAWSGSECLAKEEIKCDRITASGLCGRAQAKFGINCAWDGNFCTTNATVLSQA